MQTWRRYRGGSLDLLELNRLVLDHHAPEPEPLDTGNNRIEGRVSIHPTAELTSSIIVGPSIIGAGARISDSFVGPYTSIGAGAEIEGAEVERSIIADGARIMHIGRRIEGSTVGQRATIFARLRIAAWDPAAYRAKRRARPQLRAGARTPRQENSRRPSLNICRVAATRPRRPDYHHQPVGENVSLAIVDAVAEHAGAAGLRATSPYLASIANMPLIWHVLDELAEGGVERALIIARADARRELEEVLDGGKSWGVEVSYSEAPETDGEDAVLTHTRRALSVRPCSRVSGGLPVPRASRRYAQPLLGG